MNNFVSVLLTALALVLGVSGQITAAPVFSDNFNSETQALAVTGNTLANFNVVAGDVDVIGSGFFEIYPGNGNYIDLVGYTPGTIETNSSFGPGTYLLTFDIGGNFNGGNPNSVVVSFGTYNELFTRSSLPSFESISRLVTINSNSTLVFSTPGVDTDFGGIVLDNVTLTAVPEPATLTMLGAGVLGLFGYRLRRKNATPAVA